MRLEINVEELISLGIDANIYTILYLLYIKDSRTLIQYLNSAGKLTVSTFEKLLSDGYITLLDIDKAYVPSNVAVTEKTIKLFVGNKDEIDKLFKELTDLYPKTVVSGLKKRRLHTELDNCKILYKKVLRDGKSYNIDLHNKILKALKKEISEKTISGDLIYMTQLVRYIRNKLWEPYFDDDEPNTRSFKKYL